MAEEKKQHVYDESKIKTLSSLEHIRLRTGMYIGRIGNGSNQDDGCYILLKEVVDSTIDGYFMQEAQIKVEGTPRADGQGDLVGTEAISHSDFHDGDGL